MGLQKSYDASPMPSSLSFDRRQISNEKNSRVLCAPAANIPVVAITQHPTEDNGTVYKMSPNYLLTDSSGNASFSVPNRSYHAAQVVSSGMVSLWMPTVEDVWYSGVVQNDGTIDWDPNLKRYGSSAAVNIYTLSRPEFIGLSGQPYDATYNVVNFSREDLSGIPNHANYELRLLDPATYEVTGVASCDTNSATLLLKVNTNYAFVIVAGDTSGKAYCNSDVFTFNTGPALWKPASSNARSLSEPASKAPSFMPFSKVASKKMASVNAAAGLPTLSLNKEEGSEVIEIAE